VRVGTDQRREIAANLAHGCASIRARTLRVKSTPLFLLPTGLADGLALKEAALRRKYRRLAPGAHCPIGSPAPGATDAPRDSAGYVVRVHPT
jgi:hypothetical protein